MKKALPKSFLRMGIFLFFCIGIFNSIACGNEQNLSNQIESHVQTLEYSKNIAEDFSKIVFNWKDKHNKPILETWAEKIAEATSSKSRLSQLEENISQELAEKIKTEITFNEKFYELPDVIKYRQTQCLGYTEIFYILGNAIGLKVNSINITEMRTGKLSNIQSHVANLVSLSDGKTIIVDLVPNGLISIPFTLEEQFEMAGDFLEIKDNNNTLGLDRKLKILKINELIAFRYNNRGSSSLKKTEYTNALKEFDKAIKYNTGFAEAFYNRAIAFRNLENIENALADCNQAIKLNSNFTEAYANRGMIYSKMGQLNLAINDYTKAIKINPEFANAYYNRGIAYNKTGQYNLAIADYDQTIKLNQSLAAKAYNNRGISFAILGKSEQAKKDLLKAAQLNPELKEVANAAIEKLNTNLN